MSEITRNQAIQIVEDIRTAISAGSVTNTMEAQVLEYCVSVLGRRIVEASLSGRIENLPDITAFLAGISPSATLKALLGGITDAVEDIRKNPLIGYYECDTAGDTSAKTVTAAGYVLPATGGSVKIKMANRNTVADATLNINSTGAKPLYYNGQRAGVGNTWDTNEIIEVFYDGAKYQAYNVAGCNNKNFADFTKTLFSKIDISISHGGVNSANGENYSNDARARTPYLDGHLSIGVNPNYKIINIVFYDYNETFVSGSGIVFNNDVKSTYQNYDGLVRLSFARVDDGTISDEELDEILNFYVKNTLKSVVPYYNGEVLFTGLQIIGEKSVHIDTIVLFDAIYQRRVFTINETFDFASYTGANPVRLLLDIETGVAIMRQGNAINMNEIVILNYSIQQRRFISGLALSHLLSLKSEGHDEINMEYAMNIGSQEKILIDKASGNRNVNYMTGEFVPTTTSGFYANEIELDGTELGLDFFAGNFSGPYGYAFMDASNNYIFGKQLVGVQATIKHIDVNTFRNAIGLGAAKLRISVSSNYGDGLTISLYKNRKIASNPSFGEYDYIGSPANYLSDMNTDGLQIFPTLDDVYAAYDSLASQHPELLKREPDIGMDATNTYPIRHYTLKMQYPLITDDRGGTGTNQWDDSIYKPARIILNMGTHCSERKALLAGFLAVKEIIESQEDWAVFIKSNLIIDIVPCMSPWSAENGWVSTNSNGKDLNRTFVSDIQPENTAMINLIGALIPKGLIGCIDLHNTATGTSYMVSKPSYWAWNYYAKIAQRLQGLTYQICKTIFYEEKNNYFHLWDASANSGQLHQYVNSLGLLGCTIEVTQTDNKFKENALKGVMLEKTFCINMLNSMSMFRKMSWIN